MVIYNAVDEHGIDHVPVHGDAYVLYYRVVTYIVKLIFEKKRLFNC